LLIIDGVGGASDDWAKSEGVKYVTTLEVRDTGSFGKFSDFQVINAVARSFSNNGILFPGFMLPADQIIPTAEGKQGISS